MSLKPCPVLPVPAETARVAQAAFPNGNRYLTLRDRFGPLFQDEDFADLYSDRGQPAYSPSRLAVVSILQFMENLSDRRAAEAVRARIDWKYLLGLPLDARGFDASVLCEFRARLLRAEAGERLFDRILGRLREEGFLKKRGRQRTDSTYVLGSVRSLNRLELLGETVRATLNELATKAPDWLSAYLQPEWTRRYGPRVEESHLPDSKAGREKAAQQFGEDGFYLLDRLDGTGSEEPRLRRVPSVQALRAVWKRHFTRDDADGTPRLLKPKEIASEPEVVSSPYDPDVRFCMRQNTKWTGYRAHLSETCDEEYPRLVTGVDTTDASVHEAKRIGPIHQSLSDKGMSPSIHLVDTAYASADAAIEAKDEHGTTLVGPPTPNASWQARADGAFSRDQFTVNWDKKTVSCPAGKQSGRWTEGTERGREQIRVRFAAEDCQPCPLRSRCTNAKKYGPQLTLRPQRQDEAMKMLREMSTGTIYKLRQGIEGTISQAVRACGLRKSRYRGLRKTALQSILVGTALNLSRVAAWIEGREIAKTRVSALVRLAEM